MNRLLLMVLLLTALHANAQQSLWSPDSLSTGSPNFAMDRYNQLLSYHDPIMYLTFPVINPVRARAIPLRNGEGKEGYWLEGSFSHRFVIHKGKYYNPKWLQKLRFTFDASLMPRLTRDSSSPLLPSNNKFGVGIDWWITPVASMLRDRATPVWLSVQLHHYSNGGADSFYFKDADGNQRNNYRSGDFSTNYLRAMVNVAHVGAGQHVLSAGVGYQRELELTGPLGLSQEFYHSYGMNRLLFSFQWLRASKLVTVNNITSTSPHKVTKRRQFAFRTDMEYVLGNMENFPMENKHRLGIHGYLTYMPSLTNEVGFMLHAYTGRDYLNIRYDDVVFIAEAGLYMRINKK